ncbi:MAG: NADH-quinone oxidoreductase subunit A [Thermoleophilia bacterium]|jgi:NADH-quinone oxidoreductase subunit A
MVNETIDFVIQFALMFAIGAVMAVAFIAISHLLSPTSRNPNKGEPYECGVVPKADARAPFNVHYYIVAVLFVLFDLEAVFIYPWAISLRALGTAALFEMLVFIAILFVGLIYAWKQGVLDWE